jgi:hypothetical protein
VTENGILIRFYDEELPDPWYDDTPEWQEGLERTLAEAEHGIGMIYESGVAFLEALERMSKTADLPA